MTKERRTEGKEIGRTLLQKPRPLPIYLSIYLSFFVDGYITTHFEILSTLKFFKVRIFFKNCIATGLQYHRNSVIIKEQEWLNPQRFCLKKQINNINLHFLRELKHYNLTQQYRVYSFFTLMSQHKLNLSDMFTDLDRF